MAELERLEGRTTYPPATEQNKAFWLQWAHDGYVAGNTTVEEFEQAVEDALNGRYVQFDGKPAEHDRG